MSEPTPEFVEVYSKTTKQKQTVPAHWLEDPVLGEDFQKTPVTKAADKAKDQ